MVCFGKDAIRFVATVLMLLLCACLGCCRDICPTMLDYKTHADAGSLYNTPPCWSIYICGLVFKRLRSLGGIDGE